MPVLATAGRKGISIANGAKPSTPRALANTPFFNTFGHGLPRRDNLVAIRVLESTPAIVLPLETIKQQIGSVPWRIRVPEGIDGTPAHDAAIEDATAWLDGGFNSNRESFQALLKRWIHDVVSIDSGILELVPSAEAAPDGGYYLAEMYVRDGATFTKNPDQHGVLPRPEDNRAAYWQHSLSSVAAALDPRDAIFELVQGGLVNPGSFRPFMPVSFPRDAIVWTEARPRPWDEYGQGVVQAVRLLAELILNMDHTNKKNFTHNEVPEGLLAFVDTNGEEIKRAREYWKEEIVGQEHKVAIVGGKGDVKWLPFRVTPRELQFLESQQWYHKLVWFLFGLSPNEIGEVSDVNRSNGAEQAAAVFRKTTLPLLRLVEDEINRKILVHLEPFHRVDGELEFVFEIENPSVKALERMEQKEDLDNGTTTINEVRQARGLDDLPWGDMPLELMRSVARTHVPWALEHWVGIPEEDLPLDPLSGGGLFGLNADTDAPEFRYDDASTWTLQHAKDALRNQPAGDFPHLAGIAQDLAGQISRTFQDLEDTVLERVEAQLGEKALAFDISAVVADINISDALRAAVAAAGAKAIREAGSWHARQLEAELNDRLQDAPALTFDVDFEATNARRAFEQRAAIRMRTVNDTVRGMIRDTLVHVVLDEGGGVQEATAALRDLFGDRITSTHARLVARTEVLSAGRSGSQALAEGTDLIGGKRWIATGDTRTRSWHGAMNNATVPKEVPFSVPRVNDKKQPPDYPRSAFVVGEDQPYNCRCDQAPVLADDMPSLQELPQARGVRRRDEPRYTDGLSADQHRVLFLHGLAGEDFPACLRRLDAMHGNRSSLARSLGVGRSTLYAWGLDNR